MDREAHKALDVRIASPSTAREEMTPDEATESSLVTQRQFAWERPRPSSPPSPWLSSGTTRERISNEPRTFHQEVGASQNEPSASSDELSSPSSESSFYTSELSFDTDKLRSLSDSETIMAWQAKVARKKTYAKAREKKTRDELKESVLVIQGRLAWELEVKVTGMDSPGMIASLGMMGLDERIMSNIYKSKYGGADSRQQIQKQEEGCNIHPGQAPQLCGPAEGLLRPGAVLFPRRSRPDARRGIKGKHCQDCQERRDAGQGPQEDDDVLYHLP